MVIISTDREPQVVEHEFTH